MKYLIKHTTSYTYLDTVSLCRNIIHVSPREYEYQRNIYENITVTPTPEIIEHQKDYFGNKVYFFTIEKPHKNLTIVAEYETEVIQKDHRDFSDIPWEKVIELFHNDSSIETIQALEFLYDSYYVQKHDDWKEYAQISFQPGRTFLGSIMDLTSRIYKDFKYQPNATTIATPLHDVFLQKSGVCQDFSHFQIACLRSLGIPVRYVSGYLLTNPKSDKQSLIGSDASHAWIQVYYPGFGWFDFDPTNNLQPSDQHIIIGWGRDYDDVSPVKGIILGGENHTINVGVSVIAAE
ncbi:MAG: transglutaminase family protein [Planctomycetes bacterium]|nr:transglutaminase family protein [Planctomycetota bacterium]